MASQRYLKTKFWDDGYIRKINPEEKLFFLYFLTNPLTNLCGVYEISLDRIVFDTGIPEKRAISIMKKFEKAGKMIYRDGWVVIVNFIKNQNQTPSILQGIDREMKLVPKNITEVFLKLKGQEGGVRGTGGGGEGTLNLTKPNLTKPNADAKFILVNTLKGWNDCQTTPMPGFVPENIVNKHGVEKVQKLVTQWGKENGGFQKFLGALKA